MGEEIYVVCVNCGKVHKMNKCNIECAIAIKKGSKHVQGIKGELIVSYKSQRIQNELYENSLKFAKEHTDKKHKIIIANGGELKHDH